MNNTIKQMRSNSLSTMMVENAPEKVMPFFLPTRYARKNSPARAGRTLPMKPIINGE